MTIWNLPWVEIAIGVSLLGCAWVSRYQDPIRAFLWGLVFTGAALACTLLAWAGLAVGPPGGVWSLQQYLFGREYLGIDDLSAPMVVVVALLHFLTALATGRTKMRRFSLSWSLGCEAIRLAMFSCKVPWQLAAGTAGVASAEPGYIGGWLLIGLLAADTVPGYLELRNRRKPTRVYVLHMALFVGLMALGWAFVDPSAGHQTQTVWATVPLMAAILIRCGTVPAHCWVTDWFEHASFGNALLFVAPLAGVYAAIRLVLPIAPDWVLGSISVLSLITALYAACMALVQNESRRFFAYLFISHASLVLVGLELQTPATLTGALCLWISVALSLGGFGLTLRALEARFGRLSLAEYHGLYEHTPRLASCFVLTGLASVGFPGTLGFLATDILVDGAVEASPYVGFGVVLAAAINGIAVVRAYFLLFTGARHVSTVSLTCGMRERVAVLTLTALIVGGGLFPQPGVASRHHAAESIIRLRQVRGAAAVAERAPGDGELDAARGERTGNEADTP